MFRGIFKLGDKVYCRFNTTRFSTGVPLTFDATPTMALYAYHADGTTSISVFLAGANITVDSNKVGSHLVTIDTTPNPGLFRIGSQYQIVISSGVVDSISQAGRVVGTFDIQQLDVYHADISFVRDNGSGFDEYTVVFLKNGVRMLAGITGASILVVKRIDGSNLIAVTTMTEVGGLNGAGIYKYTASDPERMTAGEPYTIDASATVDTYYSAESSRSVGRDT